MTQSAKKAINHILKFFLHPYRRLYARKNGTTSSEVRLEVPNHILLTSVRDAIREGHTATILVRGWSMRPFLEHQRDKVVLDSPADAKLHDAVLAEIAPGKFVLHRIIGIKQNKEDHACDEITLMGDGNIRGTELCLRKDICGTVTHYIRPNRTIKADSRELMKDIRLWIRLRPIRRFLLIIYKAII